MIVKITPKTIPATPIISATLASYWTLPHGPIHVGLLASPLSISQTTIPPIPKAQATSAAPQRNAPVSAASSLPQDILD
jgi:hypothetical protein